MAREALDLSVGDAVADTNDHAVLSAGPGGAFVESINANDSQLKPPRTGGLSVPGGGAGFPPLSRAEPGPRMPLARFS